MPVKSLPNPVPETRTDAGLKEAISCLLITRPQPEAKALAALVGTDIPVTSMQPIILPAHEFSPLPVADEEIAQLLPGDPFGLDSLLIFTSPRAVYYGLPQIPEEVLVRCVIAAIGPATERALLAAGCSDVLVSETGYTSEDLLSALRDFPVKTGKQRRKVGIVAAAGGREALFDGLNKRGFQCSMLLVYERKAALIDPGVSARIENCGRILAVWTSADVIEKLSEGLSKAAWEKVCAGDWLVISERLAAIARCYQPRAIHLSAGPGNEPLASAIRQIYQSDSGEVVS